VSVCQWRFVPAISSFRLPSFLPIVSASSSPSF
jgi:hypothetical protein